MKKMFLLCSTIGERFIFSVNEIELTKANSEDEIKVITSRGDLFTFLIFNVTTESNFHEALEWLKKK